MNRLADSRVPTIALISDLGLPLDYFRISPQTQGLSGTEIALGWQLSEKTFGTLSPRICQQQQRGLSPPAGVPGRGGSAARGEAAWTDAALAARLGRKRGALVA